MSEALAERDMGEVGSVSAPFSESLSAAGSSEQAGQAGRAGRERKTVACQGQPGEGNG